MISLLIGALGLLLAAPGGAAAGEEQAPITVAGSGTVAPYALVAAAAGGAAVEVTETGTREGLKALCAPAARPDIAAASRRITPEEMQACAEAGVTRLAEMTIGFDGIVLAQSEAASPLSLSPRDLFYALASKVPAGPDDCRLVPNPARIWRDVRADLPRRPIEAYGPPQSSGTRAMLIALGIEEGAWSVPCAAALAEVDPKAFGEAISIRDDGAWIDAGESDGALAFSLTRLPDAVGVFGLVHAKRQEGLVVLPFGGVRPSEETISSGRYRLRRPLYLYTNAEKLEKDGRLGAYLDHFRPGAPQSPGAMLLRIGLVGPDTHNSVVKIDTATGARKAATGSAPSGD